MLFNGNHETDHKDFDHYLNNHGYKFKSNSSESWEYKSAIKEIIKDAESSLYDPEVANTLNTLFDM